MSMVMLMAVESEFQSTSISFATVLAICNAVKVAAQEL